MTEIQIDGTLIVGHGPTASGPAVRVSFKRKDSPFISFACWVKEEDLSPNTIATISGERRSGGSTMIGYTELEQSIARAYAPPSGVKKNTFGL